MKHSVRKAVMAVIVNEESRVLIGSSPRDGGYKFPQGGLDPGEDIISGIKRELFEELAVRITHKDIIFVSSEKVKYFYPPDDPYYIYNAQELSVVKIQYNRNMELIPQDDEFEELHWIHPQDLGNYDVQFRLEAYTRALELCKLF